MSNDENFDVSRPLEPVILRYFETLNNKEFQLTAALFAEDGLLEPPFGSPVVGPADIARYLEVEAQDLTARPQQMKMQTLENGCIEYEVRGIAELPWFSIKACWQFILSPRQEIFVTRIKLLATLQELLTIRQSEPRVESD